MLTVQSPADLLVRLDKPPSARTRVPQLGTGSQGWALLLLHATMIAAAAAAPNTTQPSDMSAPNIESSDLCSVSGV